MSDYNSFVVVTLGSQHCDLDRKSFLHPSIIIFYRKLLFPV